MELGNALFGNSFGEFEVPRGIGWEEQLVRLFDAYAPDRDNSWREYGVPFENDVFVVHEYYWGDCTCGFDNLGIGYVHTEECFQKQFEQKLLDAGWFHDEMTGLLQYPRNWSYDKAWDLEKKIARELHKKLGIEWGDGWGVRCTCDAGKRYQEAIAGAGYPDGHKLDCKLILPNFHYKPTDYQLRWYKYPLRDSYANQDLSLEDFKSIIDKCIISIKG